MIQTASASGDNSRTPLCEAMFDVKSVVVTVLRDTAVTQQGANEYLLLPATQIPKSNFPRRYPHLPNVATGYDRDVHRYSWFCQQPYGCRGLDMC